MSADLLAKPGIRRLIQATAKVYEQALDSPSISYEIPSEMRQKLEEDIFVFSGFKTYHQLKEASLLLRDDAGHIKPFSKFYQDVSQIKEKYNRNWLRAEYNFATASAEMASHWAEYATHKEYTNLQYHTALDDKVRESHAALEGITLPYEDSFWNTAFPPNGWNCRCHVVPVLKEDYPVSDSQTAQQSFEMLTEGSEIFRFNPGKEAVIFPPHHPYYGKQGYKHCEVGDNLSANLLKKGVCRILSLLKGFLKEKDDLPKLRKKALSTKESIPEYGTTVDNKNAVTGSMYMLRRSIKDITDHALHDPLVLKWVASTDFSKPLECKYIGWRERKFNAQGVRKHPEASYFTYYEMTIGGEKRYLYAKMHVKYGKEVPYCILFDKPEKIETSAPPKEE